MVDSTRQASSQPPALRFRVAGRQDLTATLNVINQSFRVAVDEAAWEWYLYGNPYGATRVYLGVEPVAETPVAVFAFTPAPLRVRGKMVAASSGHHLCLTPEYRGGGPFIKLSQYALKHEAELGVKLALGLPNRKSHAPQVMLIKWTDLFWMDCFFKLSPAARTHTCRMIDDFGAEFDRFYTRVAGTLAFCVEKNSAWMNWRFCSRPGGVYTVWAVERGGELSGYAVLKRWLEPDGYAKAHIVDFHALDEDSASHLLNAAESYSTGCDELNLWVAPGYPYRAILEARGFAPRVEAQQPLIVKALGGAAFPSQVEPASFSYADGDFVY